jgi:adenosylhomocysteine nucleosidase
MVELTQLGTKRALFVMAAEPEYGPHLRARFVPLITGIGPVEAALHVGIALARLEAAGTLPDLIVCLGSSR